MIVDDVGIWLVVIETGDVLPKIVMSRFDEVSVDALRRRRTVGMCLRRASSRSRTCSWVSRVRSTVGLDAISAALAGGARAVLLCNPHSPTGRVFDHDELTQLAEIVDRSGARVIADEVHSPLVYPGHRHVPYATVSEAAAQHAVTLTSAAKAWNLAGLKCAQLVILDDNRRRLNSATSRVILEQVIYAMGAACG